MRKSDGECAMVDVATMEDCYHRHTDYYKQGVNDLLTNVLQYCIVRCKGVRDAASGVPITYPFARSSRPARKCLATGYGYPSAGPSGPAPIRTTDW